jgi:hypothetical protein
LKHWKGKKGKTVFLEERYMTATKCSTAHHLMKSGLVDIVKATARKSLGILGMAEAFMVSPRVLTSPSVVSYVDLTD